MEFTISSDYLKQMNKSIFQQSTTYDYNQYSQKLELQYLETKYQIKLVEICLYV